MNRYFIVIYTASSKKGLTTGHQNFSTNGGYIEFRYTRDYIMRKNKEFLGITITNIIEVSKSDYDDWES